MLARNGIVIPNGSLGNIFLSPEEKLTLIMKYEKLGIDTAELRSDDIAIDCDPSKKQLYLQLSPPWFFYHDINKNRVSYEHLVREFWRNADRLLL